MVSRNLFDFLRKLNGTNKRNLFVYVGEESTVLSLDASWESREEKQVAMKNELLKVEMPPKYRSNLLIQMARVIFHEILEFYDAEATVKSFSYGECISKSECDVYLDWATDLKASTSTLPIGKSHYETHLRKPEAVYSSLNFLGQSFGLVWLTVLVTLAVLSLTMWAMVRCLQRYGHQSRPLTLADAVSENISALAGHGFNYDIKSLAYRILVLVALVWSMMMSITFATNLVSYLCAHNAQPTKYTSVIDLLERGDYSLCNLNIHSELTEILNVTEEFLNKHKNKINLILCKDFVNLNNLICSEKVAYLTHSLSIMAFNKDHPGPSDCPKIVLDRVYGQAQHGLAIRPHMKFREHFNHVILRLQETGLMQKITEILVTGSKFKMDVEPVVVAPLQVGYIIAGYFAVIGLCYVILLVEIGVNLIWPILYNDLLQYLRN